MFYIHSWYMMAIESWLVFKISKYCCETLWLVFEIEILNYSSGKLKNLWFKHCPRAQLSPIYNHLFGPVYQVYKMAFITIYFVKYWKFITIYSVKYWKLNKSLSELLYFKDLQPQKKHKTLTNEQKQKMCIKSI